MAATTFGVRYPSLSSPGKIVYANGSGSAEDPYVVEQKLSGGGYYYLFSKFLRADSESGITITFDLYQNVLQDWFPLMDDDNETLWSLALLGDDTDSDIIKSYRIPLPPFNSAINIAGCEDRVRLNVVCGGAQAGGWCFLTMISAINPSIAPHITDGFTRVPTGGIEVVWADGTPNVGHWKILHETDFRDFSTESVPVVLEDLGVGTYVLTFEVVGGHTPPVDVFVNVLENQITQVEATYVAL